MFERNDALIPIRDLREPFAALRQMASDVDRMFQDWPALRLPTIRARGIEAPGWTPRIDVFERDRRLITRVDLPGMKKEDVSVEIAEGFLTLSGERKSETEETRDDVYRREREYGSFHRSLPLPDGVRAADVRATFADGVLEVSIPLPAAPELKVRKVPIEAPKEAVKVAGAGGAS